MSTKEIIRGHTGWYVVDQNGFCSGPHSTASEALYAIKTPEKKAA